MRIADIIRDESREFDLEVILELRDDETKSLKITTVTPSGRVQKRFVSVPPNFEDLRKLGQAIAAQAQLDKIEEHLQSTEAEARRARSRLEAILEA